MKSIINKIGNLTLGIGIWIGLSMWMQWLAALTVDLWVDWAVQYIKKIFLTTDGTNDTSEMIILDGTNGNISMSGDLKIYGSISDPDSSVIVDDGMNVNGNVIVNNSSTQSLIAVRWLWDWWTYSALYLWKYWLTNNQYSWVIASKEETSDRLNTIDQLDIGFWKDGNYIKAMSITPKVTEIEWSLYLGRINPISSVDSFGYGNKLYFLGGPGNTSWDSRNSDSLWISRYNKDLDSTELRINIWDNTDGSDSLNVITKGDTLNPISLMSIDNIGNLKIKWGIYDIDDEDVNIGENLTITTSDTSSTNPGLKLDLVWYNSYPWEEVGIKIIMDSDNEDIALEVDWIKDPWDSAETNILLYSNGRAYFKGAIKTTCIWACF